MNRDDYLNSCAKYIGRLAHEIRALNAVGRFDINTVTEDFLIPIVKVLFECPDLQNQNEMQQNFPSVDLGCRTSRLSFQVTTDASSDKVTKTLSKFREHKLDEHFDHVYVLAITEKQKSYSAKALVNAISALPVPFDPSKHVIDVADLLSLLKRLETSKLEEIEAYLASEFARQDERLRFRGQLDEFLEFSAGKIEYEKRSKKYIPSIFVETHKIKEDMRFFAHPLFFYRKIQDLLADLDYSRLNELLRFAGKPELKCELDRALIDAAPTTFVDFAEWEATVAKAIDREREKVRPLSWDRKEEEKHRDSSDESPAWYVVRVQVEGAANGLNYRLRDAIAWLQLMRKKVFLITSMAGQGKTNFVCDLVERQFQPFEIPCIFIPARELNSYAPRQRLFGFISNNRYAPSCTDIHGYFDLFDDVARESGKPFIVVIDGINEVTALDEFADELRDFLAAACQYDHVKVVVTCRSEFFDDRYASILNQPFSALIHRVPDLRSQMSDGSKVRMLRAYLRHFKIDGRLGGSAEEFLKNDPLLLRIFCERHEGDDVGHTTDIYKGDLFEEFLLRKMETFPEQIRGDALPTLLKIASGMLSAGDFTKISVRGFSASERAIVERLVIDDVILRQELPERNLAGLGDLVISFTYDELRDFVVAYKLVTDDDTAALERELSQLPGRPILEGVFRYVYLLARKGKRTATIEVCERVANFTEHYSLNAHLLPPAVQNADDVVRVRAILADTSTPNRLRRVASFLLKRRNSAELLNAAILIEHLNSLESEDHRNLVAVLFANDYSWREWQNSVDEYVQNLWRAASDRGLADYQPEGLAFFLHVSSHATWSQRERASSMFRSSINQPSCQRAIALVQSGKSRMLLGLLSDINEPMVADAAR